MQPSDEATTNSRGRGREGVSGEANSKALKNTKSTGNDAPVSSGVGGSSKTKTPPPRTVSQNQPCYLLGNDCLPLTVFCRLLMLDSKPPLNDHHLLFLYQ